jgi:aspartate aminotransferase/aminotransferase
MDHNAFLSDNILAIEASGIRKVFDLASTMKDPIDLSMGQPDFKVPDAIKQGAIDAIQNDRNGYTVTHGLPVLREAISERLKIEYNGWTAPLIVTCGVSGGLTLALMACVNPGDEVLFADPFFVSYRYLVTLVGGKPKPVDITPEFKLDPDKFERAITPKSKILLINSPSNPSGVVHAPDEIEAMCRLAEKHNLIIISDEIYRRLSFDGPPTSPTEFAPDRTILLGGYGKTFAVTGWRMGFAAGPEAIINQMVKAQQFTFVCAPHIAQLGVLAGIDTDMSQQVNDYRAKRDLAVNELSPAFKMATPRGGFFIFAETPPGFKSGTEFVEAAIKRNVLCVPGSAFSERDTHFRISYAVPDDRLQQGCAILRQLAQEHA